MIGGQRISTHLHQDGTLSRLRILGDVGHFRNKATIHVQGGQIQSLSQSNHGEEIRPDILTKFAGYEVKKIETIGGRQPPSRFIWFLMGKYNESRCLSRPNRQRIRILLSALLANQMSLTRNV